MKTTRRAILGHAGAAAAVYTLGPARGAAAAVQSANDRVGLGFIGSGIRGAQLMAEFLRLPGIEPVMGVDAYDGCVERIKEQTGGRAATGKDYRAVLDRKDIDAVVIATPDHLHKRMTLDALAAGKHVYIEKPLTWSIEEGPELIAAEKRSGKVVMVGSGPKTSALTAKARELVAKGALGQVTHARMVNNRNDAEGAWRYPIPPDASPQTIDWTRFLGSAPKRAFSAEVFFRWRCWWEYSGGVATDLFVHMLTTLHEVMDVPAPVSVVSQGGLFKWKDGRTVPDVLESVFEYEKGFLFQACVNLCTGYQAPNLVVHGTAATMVLERGRITLYPERERPDVQSYGTLGWSKAARAAYFSSKGWSAEGRPPAPQPAPAKPEEIAVERAPSHTELFIDSLRNNKPSRENATEGHYAAGAAHVANRAYKEGRRMRWDYKANRVSG
jgi:predicted dehydrogenase